MKHVVYTYNVGEKVNADCVPYAQIPLILLGRFFFSATIHKGTSKGGRDVLIVDAIFADVMNIRLTITANDCVRKYLNHIHEGDIIDVPTASFVQNYTLKLFLRQAEMLSVMADIYDLGHSHGMSMS